MEFLRGQHGEYIEVVTTNGKQAAFVIEDKLGLTNFKMIDDRTIRIYEPNVSPVELSRVLIINNVGIEALNKKKTTLEAHFLKLIQAGAEDV